jgi:broad specificity phosphatase PhoE
MVTVYYVRHGQNRANLTGEISHRVVDYPLTDLGRTQAEAVARQLATLVGTAGATPVTSSPLRRAAETAETIAAALGSDGMGAEVVIDERLREVNAGALDGRADEEAWAEYHRVTGAWMDGRYDEAFPSGEDHHTLSARFAGALRDAAARAAQSGRGGPAVLVGHGGIVRYSVPVLCPGEPPPAEDLVNCGMAELAVPLDRDAPVRLVAWPCPNPLAG